MKLPPPPPAAVAGVTRIHHRIESGCGPFSITHSFPRAVVPYRFSDFCILPVHKAFAKAFARLKLGRKPPKKRSKSTVNQTVDSARDDAQ
jgi:hypothetical protein